MVGRTAKLPGIQKYYLLEISRNYSCNGENAELANKYINKIATSFFVVKYRLTR